MLTVFLDVISPQNHTETAHSTLYYPKPPKSSNNFHKVSRKSAGQVLDIGWISSKTLTKISFHSSFLYTATFLPRLPELKGPQPGSWLALWLVGSHSQWLLRLVRVASLVTTERQCRAEGKLGGIFYLGRAELVLHFRATVLARRASSHNQQEHDAAEKRQKPPQKRWVLLRTHWCCATRLLSIFCHF